jgi:hypothetical protein
MYTQGGADVLERVQNSFLVGRVGAGLHNARLGNICDRDGILARALYFARAAASSREASCNALQRASRQVSDPERGGDGYKSSERKCVSHREMLEYGR